MNQEKKKAAHIRKAGGQVWIDETLADWDPSKNSLFLLRLDDFRIFCGDLGVEVTDEHLEKAFGRYPSFAKARVIRDKKTGRSKGYGFVSFQKVDDFISAMKEMNGKYVGSRPIKLRKSTWKDRNVTPKSKNELRSIFKEIKKNK